MERFEVGRDDPVDPLARTIRGAVKGAHESYGLGSQHSLIITILSCVDSGNEPRGESRVNRLSERIRRILDPGTVMGGDELAAQADALADLVAEAKSLVSSDQH